MLHMNIIDRRTGEMLFKGSGADFEAVKKEAIKTIGLSAFRFADFETFDDKDVVKDPQSPPTPDPEKL